MKRFLIVSNVTSEALTVKDILTGEGDASCNIEWLRDLDSAIQRLYQGNVDAIIADFSLPDSRGMATFDDLFAVAPAIPILMLCPTKAQELGVEALRRGAGGYLLKDAFGTDRVSRSIHYVFHWPPMHHVRGDLESQPSTLDPSGPPAVTRSTIG